MLNMLFDLLSLRTFLNDKRKGKKKEMFCFLQWIWRRRMTNFNCRISLWNIFLLLFFKPGNCVKFTTFFFRLQLTWSCLVSTSFFLGLVVFAFHLNAKLLPLGLATHEPHFTILREEFKPNQKKPCDLCGQVGEENN